MAGESSTYTYDPVGNRTDKGGAYLGGTNRITAFGGWTYNTDLDGNVTNRDSTGVTTTFSWNAEGQLTGTTKTGKPNATYYYDANGRLVRKDTGATAAYFLWDGDNLLAEFGSNATSKKAEYSYRGIDELHALVQDSSGTNVTRYAHDDGLGNMQALTNSAGTAVARTFKYDDWGRLTDSTGGSLQPAADRVRWKGALLMGGETDSYFMRNRWYEPATGRFLSEDPIGLAGGINPFVFTGSDPVKGRDPLGLECYNWVWIQDIYVNGQHVVRLYEVIGEFCGGAAGGGGSGQPGTRPECTYLRSYCDLVEEGVNNLLKHTDGLCQGLGVTAAARFANGNIRFSGLLNWNPRSLRPVVFGQADNIRGIIYLGRAAFDYLEVTRTIAHEEYHVVYNLVHTTPEQRRFFDEMVGPCTGSI